MRSKDTSVKTDSKADTVYQPLLSQYGTVFEGPAPEARRVFHGRGQCYPGLEHLSVDWYPPVLLLTFHRETTHLDHLLEQLLAADVLQQVKSIVVQSRQRHRADSALLWGEEIPACLVEEDGLKFEVRPGRNRNAGLFLDMRPLRRWLQANSTGASVLNLFAYTCSLSVAALAGGASRVVNVDMNKPSIQWGIVNHQHNDQNLQHVVSLPHNIFKSWGRIKQLGRYDTIIVDPPTRQRGSFDAEKNYSTVIRRIPKLVKPGASVIATVNSPHLGDEYLIDQFARHAPDLELVKNMPAAPEFVEKYPQRGLKIYRFQQPEEAE